MRTSPVTDPPDGMPDALTDNGDPRAGASPMLAVRAHTGWASAGSLKFQLQRPSACHQDEDHQDSEDSADSWDPHHSDSQDS